MLAGSSIALHLLEADGVPILSDRQLGRKADSFDVPPTARVGLDCAPSIDRPEGRRIGCGLKGDNGRSVCRADDGIGNVADLEAHLVPGRGEAVAAAVEEGLGTAVVVRDEQIRDSLVVPGVVVMTVFGSGVAADAEGLGIGPFRRSEENLAMA